MAVRAVNLITIDEYPAVKVPLDAVTQFPHVQLLRSSVPTQTLEAHAQPPVGIQRCTVSLSLIFHFNCQCRVRFPELEHRGKLNVFAAEFSQGSAVTFLRCGGK